MRKAKMSTKMSIRNHIEIELKKKFNFKIESYVINAVITAVIIKENITGLAIDICDISIESIIETTKESIVDIDYMNSYNVLYDIEERYTFEKIRSICESIAYKFTIKELLQESQITHCATIYDYFEKIDCNLEIHNKYYTTITPVIDENSIYKFSLSFNSGETYFIFNEKKIAYFNEYFFNTFVPCYKKIYGLNLMSTDFRNEHIDIADDILMKYVNVKDIEKLLKANKVVLFN